MDISELIEQGKIAVKNSTCKSEYTGTYYYGPEYDKWIAISTRFVEQNFPNDPDTQRYEEIAKHANNDSVDSFSKLIAILEAFDTFPPVPESPFELNLVKTICTNFNKFDVNIKRRHGNRDTIHINDEYDLQDALRSILRLFIDDIRPEDFVPSYAGGNSRVDFFIPERNIVIETKMASSSLRDKEIGEQLMIDVDRYKQLPQYQHLICFVYDKDSNVSNPTGLISDLEKLTDNKMQVSVIISPT